MKIDANDIKVGNILLYKERFCLVLKTMHTQPGKGGAYIQVEMKDVQSGTKSNVRFRSSESVQKAYLETFECQFLYREGDNIAVMNNVNYDQLSIPINLFNDQLPFLQDSMILQIEFHENIPVKVILPETVVEKVVECEAVIKGQTVSSSFKPALLANGVRVMVPQFINVEDKIVVKTETREYVERFK